MEGRRMGAMGPFLTPNLDFLTPKSQRLTLKYLTLTLHKSMGRKKPQKSHILSPKNPIKNPINVMVANGCEKTLKSAIFSPKIGLFHPKIANIHPKVSHFDHTETHREEKSPKSHIPSPKNPIKNPITATAAKG